MNPLPTIGLFGGTFDPIHIGHLRMAIELKQHLSLDEMRLLPSHIPPHREQPKASAVDRLEMVQLAVAESLELVLDDIELRNQNQGSPAPSYTIDTLKMLREQLGSKVSLCLAVGMDSLVSLNTWHRWRELIGLAHLVVVARPGWLEPEQGEMADYVAEHRGRREDLLQWSHGKIIVEELSLLPISSTDVRAMIEAARSPEFLIPNSVWQFIQDHKLYR